MTQQSIVVRAIITIVILHIFSSVNQCSLVVIAEAASTSFSDRGSNNPKRCNIQCNTTTDNNDPISIFILAGQSNMQGKGSIEHLKKILRVDDDDANDVVRDSLNAKKNYLGHLWDSSADNFAQRSDVYIFDDYSGDDYYRGSPRYGPLSVGYGTYENQIGPELEFGWVMGDNNNSNNDCSCKNKNPIVLLKYAAGGKSLAVDFRPPSSGIGSYTDEVTDPKNQYGYNFREMIHFILSMISSHGEQLSNIIPDLTINEIQQRGVQLTGMVWIQGWNDLIDVDKVREYEINLVNFIHDVRYALNELELPIVIAELGQYGTTALYDKQPFETKQRISGIRHAQQRATRYHENTNNTKFVPTAHLIDTVYRKNTGDVNSEQYNGIYHYFGLADAYIAIGHACGEAMIQLLQEMKKDEKSSIQK